MYKLLAIADYKRDRFVIDGSRVVCEEAELFASLVRF